MLHRLKRGPIALLAVAAFVCAAQTASAGHLSSTNQMIRITWRELRFQGLMGIELTCPITIEGSFHARTIRKFKELEIGKITRAVVNQTACTGGTASFLNGVENAVNTLPWNFAFDSFTGTLPRITAIRTLIFGFSVRLRDRTLFGEADCLFMTREESIAAGSFEREAESQITGYTPDFTEAIDEQIIPAINCPRSILWGGSNTRGRVTVLGSTEAIDVTLI